MEDDIRIRLEQLEKKIDATFAAADKTRKYMQWTAIISIAVIVLPMFGLIFVIPTFLSTYANMQGMVNGL